MGSVAGCTQSTDDSEEEEDRVEIVEQRSGVTEYGNPTVRGLAENTADRELSYVEIQARFFDANGTRVGSGMDNIRNLGPGNSWEFEALCIDCPDPDRLDSYELEVTTSF